MKSSVASMIDGIDVGATNESEFRDVFEVVLGRYYQRCVPTWIS